MRVCLCEGCPPSMQLRAGDIVCVGPPVGAVLCNPGQDHISRSANLRVLRLSASCGFPHHEWILVMFTLISSLQQARRVAPAMAGGQRVTLLDRLPYDIVPVPYQYGRKTFLVDLHTRGRGSHREHSSTRTTSPRV